VAFLRDENRRKDEIIMQQAVTMRQLTAASSQEASEAPETVEEAPDRATVPERRSRCCCGYGTLPCE
jgi:hypothetical protein